MRRTITTALRWSRRAQRVSALLFRRTDNRREELWLAFVRWFDGLGLSENAVLLGFAVVIGAAGALAIVAFYALIDLAYFALYRWPGLILSHATFLAYRPVITAIGLYLAWLIVRRVGDAQHATNIPAVQVAIARRGGHIPARPALVRTAASAVTLGGGGSAGSEGPVAVLGAALGSFLGQAFRFDAARVKILVASGAAAGIAAAFNAPLTGAFFALEEILGSLAVGAFPAVVVSSVVAAVVARSIFGNHSAISIATEHGYSHSSEILVFYPLLGLVTALVAVLFVRAYFRAEEIAARSTLPAWSKPVLGGIAVGVLVFASSGALVGYGHLALNVDELGRMTWYVLGALALGKIVATAITLQFGGTGGVFTPSLFVGAATGGAFGAALAEIFPQLQLNPVSYALVGMGAVVAAATAAPITGILIVFEMTYDYAIMLPLMLSTVIAFVAFRHMEKDSLYSGWLRRRGERIVHGNERDVLEGLRAADALHPNAHVIDWAATMQPLLEHLEQTDQMAFPVVDADTRLVGMISLADLGRLARHSEDLRDVVVAADIARSTDTIPSDASLLEAVRRMGVRGSESIPMIDPETGRYVGLVTRAHVLGLYERTLAAGRTRP